VPSDSENPASLEGASISHARPPSRDPKGVRASNLQATGDDSKKEAARLSLGLEAVETAALGQGWKNSKAIFPPLPQHLENSPPTALRVSHSFHSFGGWFNSLFYSKGDQEVWQSLSRK
jgi:hypothetical protein